MDVKYSLGPFCNWFLPSCLDIWSSCEGREGRVLCSYGARSMVCLLSIANNKSIKAYDCLNVFKTNKIIISCTKFNKRGPNGLKRPVLFIGSNEGEAAILDCNTKQLIYQKIEINDLPSKKILSCDWSDFDDNPIVYYCIHSVIICWNTKTNTINKLKIGDNYRNKIAISCITSSTCGQQKLAVGYMNGDIIVIYLETKSAQIVEQSLVGHNDDICSLAFSWTKGQYEEGILASVSRDGFVKVWDVIRKYNISDIKLEANKSKNKNWFSLAVVPNHGLEKFEILIGSGNGELLSIEIPNKPPDSKIRVHRPNPFCRSRTLFHNSVVFSIAVDVRTMFAITSSIDHQIIAWDLNDRKAVDTYYTFSHGLHDISMSPIDPFRLAFAIGDGIHVIKFDEHLNVINQLRFPPPTKGSKDSKGLSIVWHPECENRLAYGSSLGEIAVLDIHLSQKYPKNEKYLSKSSNYDSTKIYALVWGPSLEDNEESTLYCVHQSGRLYLHYISTKRVIEFTHYIEDSAKRTEINWKSNYNHLVVGNDDGTVDVFQHISHKLYLKLRINSFKKAVLCLQWNSNKDEETSNWLAISSFENKIYCYSLHNYLNNDANHPIDGTVSVPVVSKPNYILKGHSERISSISWCPFDSNKLVSVSYDKTAQIWDVLKERPLIYFDGHRGLLYSVVWSAFDEDLIFSGGEDNYFHAWRPSEQPNNCMKSNDFWPHLENGNQLDIENCVENVLNDCINKVVFNDISSQNGEYNGLYGEDHKKLQKQQKNKNKALKKKLNKDLKKSSLFPLNNSIEKSSTKYQKIEDIEALINKINGRYIPEDRYERLLLYGDCNDIQVFVKNEINHHLKHTNREQKDILSLLFDIKSTIEESIEQKETNPYFVSLSMSVSRDHWKESSNLLAKQLLESEVEFQTYSQYRTEMSAIFLISQNKTEEAIDLLLSNQLFRESLVIAKLKLESEELIERIVNEWAKYRQNNYDFEGSVKCLVSIKRFSEAAELLDSRNDQQFNHTICLLRSSKAL